MQKAVSMLKKTSGKRQRKSSRPPLEGAIGALFVQQLSRWQATSSEDIFNLAVPCLSWTASHLHCILCL